MLTRLFALSPSRSVPTWGLWTFSAKYPFYLNIKLSCSAVFIFRTNSTLLCCHNLLVTRFPQVFIPQNRARRISLMRFASLDRASRLPFSFPNFSFVPDASWEFLVCPAEAFNPNSSSFRRIELTGSESWETQPWTFVFCLTTATVPWVPSFLDPALRLLLVQHAEKRQRMPQMHMFPRLVTTTHGMMPIIAWRSFSSCQP